MSKPTFDKETERAVLAKHNLWLASNGCLVMEADNRCFIHRRVYVIDPRDRNVTWGARQMTIKETRYNSAAREWFDAHPEEEAAE